MSGHGEKLSRRQEAAVSALLGEATISAAAERAGLGEATLRRWLRRPDFQSAYRAARRAVVEAAIGRLQQASGRAVACLCKNLECGNAGVEVRAALGILDQALQAVELMDLEQRLAMLECRVAEADQR